METNYNRRDNILKLREKGKTYNEICKELNCTKSLVSYYCNPNRYDIQKNNERESSKIEYEERICEIIKNSQNINQVCKSIGKRPTNNNYLFVEKIIKKYNIDISHFCNDFKQIKRHKPYTKEEIFCENSPISTSSLLLNIIKYNIKEYKCECCGNIEWLGKKIPLQTHHINGDNTDNRIENLQLLCPNCHAQTDNYCGKGKRKKLLNKYKTKICPICGNEHHSQNKFCSKECFENFKRKNYQKYRDNINKDILIECFKKYKTFRQVGKYFNVSDKTIYKWCESFNLPNKSKEMKLFLNNI